MQRGKKEKVRVREEKDKYRELEKEKSAQQDVTELAKETFWLDVEADKQAADMELEIQKFKLQQQKLDLDSIVYG